MTTTVAAVDLGAESGRVATVSFDGAKLDLQVHHRFANTPAVRNGYLRWDVDHLWTQIQHGLGTLAAGDVDIAAVGVDTWGVDYGLIGASGELLDDPICYRDDRNARSYDQAMAILDPADMYDATGIQIMQINSLFGLMADVREQPERLDKADKLLMIPDVFHHLLSGSTVTEYTGASTTAAFDMATGTWATGLLDRLGVPTHMLPEVVAPGTDVGSVIGGLGRGRLAGSRVIMPPGHDTASAVVAVPFAHPSGLFISSGTWSLAGVELPHAVITPETRLANLTNEGGYAGTIRLLRNVMGLWILQECRRQWAREGTELSYAELADLAAAEPAAVSLINPDLNDFLAPGDMPNRIREYCAARGEVVPQSIGQVARCVVDSLALSYRATVNDIGLATGVRPPTVNIVGGGSNHVLLSQMTADACGIEVHCGPVEATALGNAAVQLAALGEISSLAEIREVIAATSEITVYQPTSTDLWDEAAVRFTELVIRDRNTAGTGQT